MKSMSGVVDMAWEHCYLSGGRYSDGKGGDEATSRRGVEWRRDATSSSSVLSECLVNMMHCDLREAFSILAVQGCIWVSSWPRHPIVPCRASRGPYTYGALGDIR